MGILLDKVAVERLVAARLAKMMTQIELARASRISLRTIQQLETRGRASFSESTLIGICRTLGLPLDQILPHSTDTNSSSIPTEATSPSMLPPEQKPDPESALVTQDLTTASPQNKSVGQKRSAGKWLIGAGTILLALLLVAYYWNKVGYGSWARNGKATRDWVTYPPARLSSLTPERQAWKSIWADQAAGVEFNRLEFKRMAVVGDTLEGVIQWSYHYFGVQPNVYVNLFCEWAPNSEYHLFDGSLTGDSSITCSIKLRCPEKPGMYRVRVFHGLALAPAPGFYGSKALCDTSLSVCPKFAEAKLMVFPKSYRRKLKVS